MHSDDQVRSLSESILVKCMVSTYSVSGRPMNNDEDRHCRYHHSQAFDAYFNTHICMLTAEGRNIQSLLLELRL